MFRTSLFRPPFNPPVRENVNSGTAEPSTSPFSAAGATRIAFGLFNALANVSNDISRIGVGTLRITNSINSIAQNGMRILRAGRQTFTAVMDVTTFLLQGVRAQVIRDAQPEPENINVLAIEDEDDMDAVVPAGLPTIQEGALVRQVNRVVNRVEAVANQLDRVDQLSRTITNNPIPAAIITAALSSITGPIAQRAMHAFAIVIENTANPAFQLISCVMILAAMLHMAGNSIQPMANGSGEEETTWILLDSQEIRLQIAVEDGIITFSAISGEETFSIHCNAEDWNVVDLERRLEDWILVFEEDHEEIGPQIEDVD